MIRAVIFDCFGVLYLDPSKRFLEVAAAAFPERQQQLTDLDKEVDYGLITEDDYATGVAELLELPRTHVLQKLREGVARNEQLIAFSQALRPQYKVGLLSNVSQPFINELFPPAERERLFDVAVVSSDVGLIKPHPAIFTYTCEKLGVDPSAAVMIDDVVSNCDGARAAGLAAVHYRDLATLKRELEVLLQDGGNVV